MKNSTKLFLAASAAVLMTSTSHAADVHFEGTVDPVCQLVVQTDGIMKSSADGKTFGSKELGGAAAAVVATSNTNLLSINAQAPSSFTQAPNGGNTSVNFAAEYSAVGLGTSIPGTTPTALPIGITAMTVDLTATKTSGTFPAGDYAADVVVTCE